MPVLLNPFRFGAQGPIKSLFSPNGDAWGKYDAGLGNPTFPGSTTKTMYGSYWFRSSATDVQVHWNHSNAQNASRNFFGLNASGEFFANLVNGAAGVILDVVTTGTTYNDGNWHHVAFWCDMTSTGLRGLYIDDADATPTWNTYTDDQIGMGFRYANIFNRFDGNFQNGDLYLAEVAFDTRNFLDLGIEANRRLFLNANGTPNGNRNAWPATLDSEHFANEGDTVTAFLTNRGTAAASGFTTADTGGSLFSIEDGPSIVGGSGDILGYSIDTLGYGMDQLGYG